MSVKFMFKTQIRVMGVDDATFKFQDNRTLVIGVVVRTPSYVESVLSTDVEVDGTDSTEKLITLIERSRHKGQLKAVFIDGAAFGGFNVIDVNEVFLKCGIPLITITRDYPDFDAMKNALKGHFLDWQERWDMLVSGELIEISTAHTPIYVKITGTDKEIADELIKLTTVRGVLPEPIRLAHLIASGIATGESVSKA